MEFDSGRLMLCVFFKNNKHCYDYEHTLNLCSLKENGSRKAQWLFMHVQFPQQIVAEHLLCASTVPGPGNMAVKSQTKLVSRCFRFGGKRDNK